MLLIILLIALTAAAADHECICGDAELDEVFKFLNTVEKNEVLLPALLSPLVMCKCEETSRKKRKIFPEPTSKLITKEFEELPKKPLEKTTEKTSYENPRHDDKPVNPRNKCPLGYRRRGFLCVNYN